MPPQFEIEVKSNYIEDQSSPDEERYVFAYTITISNTGMVGAKLLNRYWLITDANGETLEVKGSGVVGEQPYIEPGKSYQYTSGTVLATPLGSMQGSYQMRSEDGILFDEAVPTFSLANPNTLH